MSNIASIEISQKPDFISFKTLTSAKSKDTIYYYNGLPRGEVEVGRMIRRSVFPAIILFIVVYVLSFPLVIETPVPVRHLDPDLRQMNNIAGQTAIIYEQRPSFFKFLKPARAFLFKFKLLHWVKLRNSYYKYFDTQNLCIALIIIALFSMFYRLSWVNAEKPSLHKMMSIQ